MNIQQRIGVLWLIMLAGFVVHTLLGLLPVFFGQSVAMPNAQEGDLVVATWMTLATTLLPLLLAMLLVAWQGNALRWPNLIVAVLFLLLNLVHPLETLEAEVTPWHQLLLMAFMIVLGIVLVVQSWRWVKQGE